MLSVTLFAILLGSGLGSWVSGRLASRQPLRRLIMLSALAMALLALVFALFVPALLN